MRLHHLVLTTAALALAAAPAAAQGGLALIPKIGAFAPLSDLGEAEGSVQELEGSLAVGLAAEVGLPVLPFDLRAGFDYATDTKVSSEGLGEEGSADEVTLLALTADAVFRRDTGGLLQPYLLLGGGIKRYDISREEVQAGDPDVILDEDESDVTGHLGLGLGLGLGLLTVTAEISDYISQFEGTDGESELQNDLYLMVGARVGLF
ncbi:MAG: hypothetical protein ACRELV_05460 [Longimicrobiales bacterium]